MQFLLPTGPLGEESLAAAIETDVEGELTRIFTAENLAALALQTGRAKDKARLLQSVELEALDPFRRFSTRVAPFPSRPFSNPNPIIIGTCSVWVGIRAHTEMARSEMSTCSVRKPYLFF